MQKTKLFITIILLLSLSFSSTNALAPSGIIDSHELSGISIVLRLESIPESLDKLGPFLDKLIASDSSFQTVLNAALFLFSEEKGEIIEQKIFTVFRLINKGCPIKLLLNVMTEYEKILNESIDLKDEIYWFNREIGLSHYFDPDLKQEIRTAYLLHPHETAQIALKCIDLSLIPIVDIIVDGLLANSNFVLCNNIIRKLERSNNSLAEKTAKKMADKLSTYWGFTLPKILDVFEQKANRLNINSLSPMDNLLCKVSL